MPTFPSLARLILTALCCSALFCSVTGPLAAQTPNPLVPAASLPDPGTLEPKFDGNYLLPLLILRPLRASYANSAAWRDDYFGRLAIDESFVGNDAEAIADFEAAAPPEAQKPVAEAKALLAGDRPVDARQAILAAAADHQAVFINEAYYVPMNRAFTLSLLRGLYAKGFRYFAAETLDEKDTGLQKRGYPTLNSGHYTREPVFGDLVRTALKLGYKVVPCQYHGPQSADPITAQNDKERGEAQNLYDRIFKNDPKAKALVDAGFLHIAKETFTMNLTPGAVTSKTASGNVTMMALWFERISKIVPFSIDQTYMMEDSAPKYESGYYRAAVEDNLLQEAPIVLKNKTGQYFVRPEDKTGYDLMVFHPRTLYQFGRPTWLSEDGQRQAYILPSDLGIPANTPALVQAFYANEDARIAVPIDQIEVKPGLNPLPALMLPAGRFRVRVVDGADTVLREWVVDRNGATP